MYSGYAQYSVELTPIIVFAAIDGSDRARKVLTPAYSQARLRLAAWIEQRQRLWQEYTSWLPRQTRALVLPSTLLLALTLTPLATSLAEQQRQAFLPIGRNYVWPVATAHTRLANEIIARIPASASVSAQSDLVPHLSNRRFVYLFPYRAVEADYVLLDVTSNPYPLSDAAAYVQNIWQTLNSGLFKVVVAQDGYLLLQRGTVQEPGVVITSLPDSFFTYTRATPDMITNRTTGVAFNAGCRDHSSAGIQRHANATGLFEQPRADRDNLLAHHRNAHAGGASRDRRDLPQRRDLLQRRLGDDPVAADGHLA